ncbi:PHD finger protein ALFIN-LIKE protein 1 [Glycine soja]|uniref:PHD finger protein ALFIN-LIKE n=1 Tax=Glycine soja TaxID=3848 RepID=A0A0B2QLG3_GLYSO|nr:PHD finger protein ALFIN-LIKE protein 1 [Glycine soja]
MASKPRSVEEIFKDYSARRIAIIRALTHDVDKLYGLCDPEEVPPELPEPTLGINFARDDVSRRDWISLVAVHSDSWLLSVAFYLGIRLNHNERKRLFGLINILPTIFQVVTDNKPIKDNPTMDSGSKFWGSTEVAAVRNEHIEIFCGSCGGNYNKDEFWIGCDICEWWYHGKCIMMTPTKAETLKHYKCASCSLRRGRL